MGFGEVDSEVVLVDDFEVTKELLDLEHQVFVVHFSQVLKA